MMATVTRKVTESVQVFYFNCRECGSPLKVADRFSVWCGCEVKMKVTKEDVFSAYKAFILEHARIPRASELGDFFGVNLVTVDRQLMELEKKGMIVLEDNLIKVPSMSGVDWLKVNDGRKKSHKKNRRELRMSEAERIERVVARAQAAGSVGGDRDVVQIVPGKILKNGRLRGRSFGGFS